MNEIGEMVNGHVHDEAVDDNINGHCVINGSEGDAVKIADEVAIVGHSQHLGIWKLRIVCIWHKMYNILDIAYKLFKILGN